MSELLDLNYFQLEAPNPLYSRRRALTWSLYVLPPAGSVYTREQAGLLAIMEPAMLGWAAARDRGDDDSDDPPQEVVGLLAALAAQDRDGESME